MVPSLTPPAANRETALCLKSCQRNRSIDPRTFAEWGVDYIKEDWCNTQGVNAREAYTKMSWAIQATGRPMILSLCEWGDKRPWQWAGDVGNLWRTTGDGKDCWDCGAETAIKPGGYPRGWTWSLDAQVGLEKYAGPGRWNDPDLLLAGLPGLMVEKVRAQFSLWAILAVPLMASCDLRTMTPAIAEIPTNKEVIAIDQDALGRQGTRISNAGEHEVWVRKLRDGDRAVVLFNRGHEPATMSVSRKEVGLEGSTAMRAKSMEGRNADTKRGPIHSGGSSARHQIDSHCDHARPLMGQAGKESAAAVFGRSAAAASRQMQSLSEKGRSSLQICFFPAL